MDDVTDSNGNILKDGNSVHIIKNIRLTDNPQAIEGRTGTIKGLVLKTEFVKKA